METLREELNIVKKHLSIRTSTEQLTKLFQETFYLIVKENQIDDFNTEARKLLNNFLHQNKVSTAGAIREQIEKHPKPSKHDYQLLMDLNLIPDYTMVLVRNGKYSEMYPKELKNLINQICSYKPTNA